MSTQGVGYQALHSLCIVKYTEFIEYTNNMNNKLMNKAFCIKIDFVKASLFSEQITKHYSSKTRLCGNPC